MNEHFIIDLKSRVSSNLHCVDIDMVRVCLAIIDHVAIGPSKKPHLTFYDLNRISPKVNEDVFYDAVFYLTKKNINVLEQQFEAINPRTHSFQHIVDKKAFIEDMRDGELYNPFVGDSLSEKEFGEQVITYFSPSKYFMEKVNG